MRPFLHIVQITHIKGKVKETKSKEGTENASQRNEEETKQNTTGRNKHGHKDRRSESRKE
jgi:hypothetical protein